MKGGFVVPEVVQSLTPFVEAGVLGPTDVHSVAAFARAGGESRHEVLLAAALAVRAKLGREPGTRRRLCRRS